MGAPKKKQEDKDQVARLEDVKMVGVGYGVCNFSFNVGLLQEDKSLRGVIKIASKGNLKMVNFDVF